MPLMILGLILIGGILIYAIIGYINSGEEDPRSVRERYPHAFPTKKPGSGTIFGDAEDGNGEFMESDHPLARILRNEGRTFSRPNYDAAAEEQRKRDNGENVIEFPTDNLEAEKMKRNIHSDRK